MRRHLLLAASALALVPISAHGAETINYSYDGQGRLVKVVRAGAVDASECYTYDAAGNRTNLNVAVGGTCTAGSGGGAVSFSVSSNGPVAEGANSVFTIAKSGTASGALTVDYATANGTATAGSDYTAKSGTLTFTSAQSSQTVSVATATDAATEGDETFNLALSAPSTGATIATGTATATITDGGSSPTCNGVSFKIASNGAVAEGANSGFTVTKVGTASGSCSVSYTTANGTATAGSDYTAKSGTLSFTSAQTSQVVNVATINDTAVESASETFSMALSAPTGGATLGTPSSATATITDNDSGGGVCSNASFSVNNAIATEGSPLVFTITKAGSVSSSCSVTYATANGTATSSSSDYTALSATVVTFTATQTTKTVSVATASNGLLAEPDETMFLNLSSATSGGTISDAQGVGTIKDDGQSGGGGTCNPICPAPAQAAPADGSEAAVPEAPADEPAPAEPEPVAVAPPPPPEDGATPPPEGR